jgi:glycosyltransferase involved in cell wall biosynthesis
MGNRYQEFYSMKVAWFTPFNKESAIGRYSKSATLALSKHADVDIFVFDEKNLHDTSLRTMYYNSNNVLSLLKSYDVCVFNIGDYSNYHAPIYDVMQTHRGVVISHDLCLHNFFRGYYISHLQRPNEFVKILTDMYGEKNAHFICDSANSFTAWAKINLSEYHMTELLYPYSLGIAVHSDYHVSKIKPDYNGPMCVVPLLYDNEWNMEKAKHSFRGYDASKINVLTVGYINQNKRIHFTIEAIASDPELRKKVHFTCIGSLGNEQYVKMLNEQITKLQLDNNIKLLGFLEHKQLVDYYVYADIIINLRYPAYEGASASLLEQMQLGKTVIVFNTGMYREMPDDCVIKINPSNEVEELRAALLDAVQNPAKFRQYGVNAKAYAEKTFSPEIYGEKLFDFIQSVIFLKPLYSITDLIGQELKDMGVSPDMRISKTLSSEIELLFESGLLQSGGKEKL